MGFPLNDTYIADAYTGLQGEETKHTIWFTQNPKWLDVSWERARLDIAAGSQQNRSYLAA